VLKRLHGSALAVTAKPGADGAVWNVIMPAGTFHRGDFGPKGVLTFDRAFFEKVIANWKKVGSPGLPVDRFHWGGSDNTAVRAEDKAAVGFIEDLRIGASGDLEGLTRWNADGKADIEADRFRYFSPEFHWDWTDQRTGSSQGPTLFGGGLLNDPYFKELPRLAASDAPTKEHNVNKKLLCARLGIPEDSTDEAINAALEKEPVKAAASDETLKASLETLKGELAKQTAAAADATKRVAAMEKAEADRALTALQDSLMKAGKLKADDKPRVEKLVAALGIKEATELTASWPVVVELGERGIPGEVDTGDTVETATAKWSGLVDAELAKAKAAGAPITASVAARRVRAAHPELAKKAFTITTAQAEA
jgi:phage I-like protein